MTTIAPAETGSSERGQAWDITRYSNPLRPGYLAQTGRLEPGVFKTCHEFHELNELKTSW